MAHISAEIPCLYEREIAPKESWWLIMDIALTYLNHLTLDVP